MHRLTIIIFLLLSLIYTEAQEKKSIHITRTETPPQIDGILDDEAWKNIEEAKNFIQFRPEMGIEEEEESRTVAKLTYDDQALYISAYLHDDPAKIMRQFSSRDNFGQSDFFMVILNPNNDAQNNTYFVVFSSGSQADAVASLNNEDFGWNAVWDSAVKIVDDGWIVEMKIPYRALRFSNDEIQTWGLQLHREFRRTNTRYTWSPIDRTKGNPNLYHGEIEGINKIEAPTRLTFYPFLSTLASTQSGETNDQQNIGLDVKYGITENFTLDATLIPDFSQAAFDNLRLNLGPFEQTFSEQRQFFKEGIDLFNKGNLFFSRRIGGRPVGSPELLDNEELVDMPSEVKVLNALKISGRSKKGLGIGFFNAITERTQATIKNNVTNESRREVVEPLTNYNIMVVDQQFNGNSSIGLVNTNVTRDGHFRDANVTALVTNISNKRNTYNIRGDIKMSNRNLADGTESGFSSFFMIRKSHGKFRYSFDHSFANEGYDINDLGLNFRNNFNNFGIDINYRIFEPTEKLNNFFINTYVNYRRLYKPSTFTGTNFGVFVNGQTKKLMWFGANINFEPGKQFDYFEPRDFENKRFFVYKNIGSVNGWINTNRNKTLSSRVRLNSWHAFDDERDLFGYQLELEPSVLINDKFRIGYGFEYTNNKGSRGYVNRINDDIIFGERDILSVENSLSGSYNFNPFHTLALTFRNFWSTVTYDENLFTLLENGGVTTEDNYTVSQFINDPNLNNPNMNFNTWNLDLSYTWQVAPGSFLTGLYRNRLFNSTGASTDTYFESLNDLFDQDMEHVLSIKLQYFIDYNNVKNVFKRKSVI